MRGRDEATTVSKFHSTFPWLMFVWVGVTMLGAMLWMWFGWGAMPPPVKFAVGAILLAAGTAVATLWMFRGSRW